MNSELSKPCNDVVDDLPEFALGTLSGRERSQVLRHLANCTNCRASVETYVAATDLVLHLGPEAEPPLGFESRVIEQFRAESLRKTSARVLPRGWRSSLVVAAALLIVAAIGAGSVLITQVRHQPTPVATHPVSVRLIDHGNEMGQVFLSFGKPSWMFMTFEDEHWSGLAICQVVLKNGSIETVGRFHVKKGYGAWSIRLAVPGEQLAAAQVIEVNGNAQAKAAFPT